MNASELMSEMDVLKIIEEEFGKAPEQEFDLVIPRAANGGDIC